MATKGTRINSPAEVTETGTRLVKNMSWETPYILFRLPNGDEAMWTSNEAEEAVYMARGTAVHVSAFAYPVPGSRPGVFSLRRVVVTRKFPDGETEHYGSRKLIGKMLQR